MSPSDARREAKLETNEWTAAPLTIGEALALLPADVYVATITVWPTGSAIYLEVLRSHVVEIIHHADKLGLGTLPEYPLVIEHGQRTIYVCGRPQ